MEQPSITFDQLPNYVYQLGRKVDDLMNFLRSQAPPTPERFFTIEELSNYLPGKPAVTTLYGKVQRREIPFSRKGKRLVFRQADIDQWLIGSQARPTAELANNYMKSGKRALQRGNAS
ncbi:hypothetical protein GCM10027299_52580 [Larkinella ripae]